MADYLLLLDTTFFETECCPALLAAWKARSFVPCLDLCRQLAPRLHTFSRAHHIVEGESLLHAVEGGLPFYRDVWRSLVSEILFVAADDIPDFPTCPETLLHLLRLPAITGPRVDHPSIWQAHFGSSDLRFGPTLYRPEACGVNARDAVQRLADYLASLDPDAWQADDLSALVPEEDERAEELAIAREWFVPLRDLYAQAVRQRQTIVCEQLN